MVDEAINAAPPVDSFADRLKKIQAEEEAKAKAGAPPPNPSSADSAAPPPMTPKGAADALMVLCDVATIAVCKVTAVKHKVPWTAKLSNDLRLSKDEKQMLSTFAPFAAPFILEIIKQAPKIAAGFFLFLWWNTLSDKLAYIKSVAPEKPKEKKVIDVEATVKAGGKTVEKSEKPPTRKEAKRKK